MTLLRWLILPLGALTVIVGVLLFWLFSFFISCFCHSSSVAFPPLRKFPPNHFRDVPSEDIIKFGASTAATKFR